MLCVISGGESILRRRSALSFLKGETFQIVHSAQELEGALVPPMFGTPPALWCRNVVPTEGMVDSLESHESSVVIEMDGEIPAKSPLLKCKGKSAKWIVLPIPKPWEKRQAALSFVQEEATKQNLVLSEALGAALVSLVGNDLGVLAFEVEKLALLTQEQGLTEATPKFLGHTIAGFVETGMEELIHNVGQKNAKHILNSYALIERTHGLSSSTVLRICAALLYHARIWLCCKTLCHGDPALLGEKLSLHPFVLKKQHFPHAVRWAEPELLTLIAGISSVQRSVRRGTVSPHLQLQGLLLGLAQHAS